jgi:hypothetical protein
MTDANYEIGDSFPVQFAWRLPDGDYLRAVFRAHVLDHVPRADKYVVELEELIAGRQEDADGEMRDTEAYTKRYWRLVGRLIGQKVSVAYEVDDGRALHMRLETLTGEHNFFYRYEIAEDVAAEVAAKWEKAIKSDDHSAAEGEDTA